MAKKQKIVQQDVAQQGQPISGWGAGIEHVLFVDRNSEISDDKVEALEKAGFIVVPISGEPGKSVFQVVRYK